MEVICINGNWEGVITKDDLVQQLPAERETYTILRQVMLDGSLYFEIFELDNPIIVLFPANHFMPLTELDLQENETII